MVDKFRLRYSVLSQAVLVEVELGKFAPQRGALIPLGLEKGRHEVPVLQSKVG